MISRRIVAVLLSLLLILVFSGIAVPVASGQEATRLTLPGPETASGTSGTRQVEPTDPSDLTDASDASDATDATDHAADGSDATDATDHAADVAPSICDESHWIISVRHCPQHCSACIRPCRFCYVRSDWNGRGRRASEWEFRQWLKPGVPLCIMVHGSFVPNETVTRDSRNTFRWLRRAAPDRPLQVVFLTWPSQGILTLIPGIATSSAIPGLDVAILGRRAEFNGFRLVQLLNMVPAETPVCLIGHSHGARMVASALDLLGGGKVCGQQIRQGPRHRIRTVLAAAAIDHDWMVPGQRFDRALWSTECLLNLRSRDDWALSYYPLRKPFSRTALGSTGFTRRDYQKLGPLAPRAMNFDVSCLIGTGHIWPEYYRHPSLAAELRPWVYFTE